MLHSFVCNICQNNQQKPIKVNFLSNKGFNTSKNYLHHVIKPYKQNNIKNRTILSLFIHKDISYLRVKGEDLFVGSLLSTLSGLCWMEAKFTKEKFVKPVSKVYKL